MQKTGSLWTADFKGWTKAFLNVDVLVFLQVLRDVKHSRIYFLWQNIPLLKHQCAEQMGPWTLGKPLEEGGYAVPQWGTLKHFGVQVPTLPFNVMLLVLNFLFSRHPNPQDLGLTPQSAGHTGILHSERHHTNILCRIPEGLGVSAFPWHS